MKTIKEARSKPVACITENYTTKTFVSFTLVQKWAFLFRHLLQTMYSCSWNTFCIYTRLVPHAFYPELIPGTSQNFSCKITDHVGTYFTVQHGTHFKDLNATVTLVTMSRHDQSKSTYAKCFRNFYFSQSAKST